MQRESLVCSGGDDPRDYRRHAFEAPARDRSLDRSNGARGVRDRSRGHARHGTHRRGRRARVRGAMRLALAGLLRRFGVQRDARVRIGRLLRRARRGVHGTDRLLRRVRVQRRAVLRGARRPVRVVGPVLRRGSLRERRVHHGDGLRRGRTDLLRRRHVPRGVRVLRCELRRVRRERRSVLHGQCVQRGHGLWQRDVRAAAAVWCRRAAVLRSRVRSRTDVRGRRVPRSHGVRDGRAAMLRRGRLRGRSRVHQRNLPGATADMRKRHAAVLHRRHVHGRAQLRFGHMLGVSRRRHHVRHGRRLLHRVGVPPVAGHQCVLSPPGRCVHDLESVLRRNALRRDEPHVRVPDHRAQLRGRQRLLRGNDLPVGYVPGADHVPSARADGLRGRGGLLRGPAMRALTHDAHLLSLRRGGVHVEPGLLRLDAVRGLGVSVPRARRFMRGQRGLLHRDDLHVGHVPVRGDVPGAR